MFASWQLLAIATAYLGALFAVAWVADRRARQRAPRERPWVYALALAVYCTAWTFYGAVGRVVDDGWSYLPIYLGPALVFLFGTPFIRRLITVCKGARLTSVADFIGARFGNSAPLAVAATLIALLAGLPYLALQLRGISLGFGVLAADRGLLAAGVHGTTLIAVLLAAFAMLFGTRHIASTESHQGMVLAVAVESVVKLLAFIAVGVLALVLLGGIGAGAAAAQLPHLSTAEFTGAPFWMQTLLAAAAILVLPRQFHLMVVENLGPREVRTARWVFPAYLAIFALFVLPLAAAGAAFVAGDSADRYVLALPQHFERPGLALLAFLGGFSAATGMVIVSCVALATMLSNEIILPAMLRGQGYQRARQDLGALLRRVRRLTIAGLLLAAWLIDRTLYAQMPLAMIGLLSFSAIAHLAPPVVAGVLWPRANRAGATIGLAAGMAVWLFTTLLPSLFPELAPDMAPEDVLVQGAMLSLSVHVVLLVTVSMSTSPSLSEQVQSARLLGAVSSPATDRTPGSARVADLLVLLERFFGAGRTRAFVEEYAAQHGAVPQERASAAPEFVAFCEHCLSSALGGASARALVRRTLHPAGGDVAEIIEQTSRAVRFNRELLHATLDHLQQGVSVVDTELRLIAWNRAYQRLFDYPDALLRVGTPVAELIRHNIARGLFRDESPDAVVQRRLLHLQRGTAYHNDRTMPDGTVLEIAGNPMPGGGFVTTFADITAYKRAQRLLQSVNEELEQRVAARTRELVNANQALRDENTARARAEAEARRARSEAEAASRSKSRFLAATSHDLAQPLNAARLFSHTLEDIADPHVRDAVTHIGHSLAAMEDMLSGLAAYSRLDAGAQPVHLRSFAVQELLDALAADFRALAAERGLELRVVPCSAYVRSDPLLLRRIVQNLLANAVRYTPRGRVLLGCRRADGNLRIEVHDTGPGIPTDKQRVIFEEFHRLDTRHAHGPRGLGLGLAIAERIAGLLAHPLDVRSAPGSGSLFHVTVPRTAKRDTAAAPAQAPTQTPAQAPPAAAWNLAGLRVLVLDNDEATLQATAALLRRWGCEAWLARDAAEAIARTEAAAPEAALIDYRLDHGADGISVLAELRSRWRRQVPAVLMTGDATAGLRERARVAGMHFLAKPVRPAALRALLQRTAKRHPS